MSCNFLMLNSENKILVLDPKNLRDSMSTDIATLDGIILASSTTVRNLKLSLIRICHLIPT